MRQPLESVTSLNTLDPFPLLTRMVFPPFFSWKASVPPAPPPSQAGMRSRAHTAHLHQAAPLHCLLLCPFTPLPLYPFSGLLEHGGP